MRNTISAFCALAGILQCLAGCVSKPSDVPPSLQPPAGEKLFLQARGVGTQIYECTAKPGSAPSYEWTLTGPNALLKDRTGTVIGWHYVGPTWKNMDGSSVIGEVRARDPGPDPTAIPWLLLATEASAQAGVFSAVTSVQRLNTVGGIAPKDPCNEQNKSRQIEVPYSATYYFYRKG